MLLQNPDDFMREALREAELAAAAGEVPVAALLVLENKIIARAHNLVETEQDATRHAEMIVLQQAAKKLGGWRLSGAALVVTLEPCPMCLGASLLSRVSEIYYGADDPLQGACGSLFDFSRHAGLPQHIEVYPHVLKQECSDLLKDFFRRRRETG